MLNVGKTRTRRSFGLESLEIRNAPSHFGGLGLAHAAMAAHQIHAHAHAHASAHVGRVHFTHAATATPAQGSESPAVHGGTETGRIETGGSVADTGPNDNLQQNGQNGSQN